MRLRCPGCQASFTVPEEKIAKARTARIPCPKCHTPMDLKEDPAESKPPLEERAPQAPQASFPSDYIEEEEGVPLDLVDENVMTALVCTADTARAELLQNVLQQLDYHVVTATRAPYAVAKLHHNRYDLVLLDETFEQNTLSENLILHHVQLLPMHARRTFFLCLLSGTHPTMDRMTAYRLGVDMILNVRDLDNAKIVLPRAMKEHRSFYAIFFDELSKKGLH